MNIGISLAGRAVALVSECDAVLAERPWHLSTHGYGMKRGSVLLHREVMARVVGRPLLSTELVHHRNGNRLDNRRENLQLMSQSEHSSLHGSRPRGPQKQAKGIATARNGWRGFANVNGRQKRGPTRSTREEALADRQRMLDGTT